MHIHPVTIGEFNLIGFMNFKNRPKDNALKHIFKSEFLRTGQLPQAEDQHRAVISGGTGQVTILV